MDGFEDEVAIAMVHRALEWLEDILRGLGKVVERTSSERMQFLPKPVLIT
jgi:hypothetical protein